MAEVEQKNAWIFRRFTYLGVGLVGLVDLNPRLDVSEEQPMQLSVPGRRQQQLNWGLQRKQDSLLKRLRKAKKEAPPMQKPEVMKTHLQGVVILPQMRGSMVGVNHGNTLNQGEIRLQMMAEFSTTYKPGEHGRPGIGATHSSRDIPLK